MKSTIWGRTASQWANAHRQVQVVRKHHSRALRLKVTASVVWRQLDCGAWAAHARRPSSSGIVHFLGGAFAGAAPQLVYNLLIELLADAGYTVIATPYAVTFRHADCAAAVRGLLDEAVAELRSSGRTYLAPPGVKVHGVGHSNGALLHLLLSSFYPGCVASNAIISYNNKQVSDAIPIPGLLGSLQPTVQAARTATAGGVGAALPDARQLLAAASTLLPPGLVAPSLVAGAAPALEQLGSVLDEVGDGTTDFTPSPAESRLLISSQYSCPATLLVRFTDDAIDETPEMAALLSSAAGERSNASTPAARRAVPANTGSGASGGVQPAGDPGAGVAGLLVEELVLPGTHLTPCGGDITWQVGLVYTPLDALAQSFKAESQADVRRLAERLLDWLRANG